MLSPLLVRDGYSRERTQTVTEQLSGPNEQVTAEFLNTVNRHGYAFQYAVLAEAGRLYTQHRSEYFFEVAEFPVQVRGDPTKIDFVLRHRERRLYLVCECKRANPAIANWCFVRAPYVRRDSDGDEVMVEHLSMSDDGPRVEARLAHRSERTYHIGFEVKSQSKGDPSGNKSGIEEAASQVCRGLNGLINFYLRHPAQMPVTDIIRLVPVIFTTANLWISETNLQATDLISGELAAEHVNLKATDWLWYQYNISQRIKHEHESPATSMELGQALQRDFQCSIAIVSAPGIKSFLKWAGWL